MTTSILLKKRLDHVGSNFQRFTVKAKMLYSYLSPLVIHLHHAYRVNCLSL